MREINEFAKNNNKKTLETIEQSLVFQQATNV